MTNEDFKKKWPGIFTYHYLFNIGSQTMLAGSYRRIVPGIPGFAWVPQINDFMKIESQDIVATIRLKSQYSKA